MGVFYRIYSKRLLIANFVGLFLIFLGSCSKEKEMEPVLDVSVEALSYSSFSAEKNVIITSNVELQISVTADWLAISVIEQETGVSLLRVAVEENMTIEQRTGDVVIMGSGLEKVIHVTQDAGSPFIKLSKEEFHVGSVGGIISIDVLGNVGYEITLPENGWVQKEETSQNNPLIFRVSQNDSIHGREMEIHFQNLSYKLDKVVRIYQEQKDSINLTESYFSYSYKPISFMADVFSNVKYDVVCSDIWISAKNEGDIGKHRVQISVKENDTASKRYATITLTNGNISKLITIEQDGMPTDIIGGGSGYIYKD